MHYLLVSLMILFLAPGRSFAEINWVKGENEIKRLRLSEFSQVPETVIKKLKQQGCEVPQVYDTRQPGNLVHGHFSNKSSDDWAALCSKNGKSSIVVIWQKGSPCPSRFNEKADRDCLQGVGGDRVGFSRQISVAKTKTVLRHQKNYGGALPSRLDHDGLDDAFLEKESVTYFCESGEWLKLQGSD